MKEKLIHFQTYLKEEIERVRGVYYPVPASFPRRVLTKHASCMSLHPNPEDEFCHPNIGPNYGIIGQYEEDFKHNRANMAKADFHTGGIREPLMVQKASPDGYLILNGHHRWAAAFRVGITRLKIKIVNLTRVEDVKNMLENSKSDKRAVLDLDEVVFRSADDPLLEKPLRFPLNRFYKERVRLGVPALLNFLNRHGYDIWVYTSRYCSVGYIRFFFKHWNVRLAGIVTGTERKDAGWAGSREELKKLMDARYHSTLHIDNSAVIRTFSGTGKFEEYPVDGTSEAWSRTVMDNIEKMKT